MSHSRLVYDRFRRRLILRSPTEQVRQVFSVVGLADWLAYDNS